MSIRDLVAKWSPPWLRGVATPGAAGPDVAGEGERYMYPLGLSLDSLIEKAYEGVIARFPGKGTPTALPLIGLDRSIVQGIGESDDSYAARLRAWLDTARLSGMAWGVMRAVLSYLIATKPAARAVNSNSTTAAWDVFAAGADITQPPTHANVTPTNWNWDGLFNPRRKFVIIDATGSLGTWATAGPLCGAGNLCGDPSISCGFSQVTSIFSTLVQIVQQWKSAGSKYDVIVTFDSTLFDYTKPAGDASLPDGLWAYYGKPVLNGAILETHYSRFDSARYLGSYT